MRCTSQAYVLAGTRALAVGTLVICEPVVTKGILVTTLVF